MNELLIAQTFTLARGVVLKNRLAKSALSEALGSIDRRVTPQLVRLYQRWAASGVGLLITGNVMVDRRAIGEPGNVALEDERDLPRLREWVAAGTAGGAALWMQLNHPGKQAPRGMNRENLAPSSIGFGPKLAPYFPTPRALTEPEIEDIIERFGIAAAIAKKAGFDGVQLHGAHGYLISQFLSPHHNRRDDAWGGTAVKRRRFVMQVYREVRRRVGEDFPVGIKLNSADFQRGGFTEKESLGVIRALAKAGIDLIEISGGTYEEPVMTLGGTDTVSCEASGCGRRRTARVRTHLAALGHRDAGLPKASTQAREAYFLEFAEKARQEVDVPLMVTGGFRSLAGMEAPLRANALDLIGLGRILAVEPDAPARLLRGQEPLHRIKPLSTGIRYLDNLGSLEVTWYTRQLHRMGRGQAPAPDENALKSFVLDLRAKGFGILRTRLRA